MKPQVWGNENSIIICACYWDFLQVVYIAVFSGRQTGSTYWAFVGATHLKILSKCFIAPHNSMHVETQALHSFQLFENLRAKCYIANLIFNFCSIGEMLLSPLLYLWLCSLKNQSVKYCVVLIQFFFLSVCLLILIQSLLSRYNDV